MSILPEARFHGFIVCSLGNRHPAPLPERREATRSHIPTVLAVMPEFISGLDSIEGGEETAAVLNRLEEALAARTPTWVSSAGPFATYLVMRQQLFCNSSLAHVMFELTNALLELGVPTVAQEEHPEFAKRYIHREEISLRNAVPEKCERIVKSTAKQYDPENAITVHFSMFSPATKGARFGTFPSLGRREVLYTTGNHTMTREGVRKLDYFEKILAPTHHVLRPYLEAGLDRMGSTRKSFRRTPSQSAIRRQKTSNFCRLAFRG